MTNNVTVEQAQATFDAIERAEKVIVESEPSDTIALTTGLVLRIKAIPPLLLQEVVRQLPDPDPPMWTDPDKGREEPNYSDPDYLKKAAEVRGTRMVAVANTALMVGTEISFLPESMQPPDSEVWLEDVQSLLPIPDAKTKRQRYLLWLRYYALTTDEDLRRAIQAPLRVVGLTEEEIAQAMSSFRRAAGGRTNNGDAPTSADYPNGDIIPAVDTGPGS